MEWIRIPCDALSEDDRRRLASILVDGGLEVRIVKSKEGTRIKRHVEYRETEAAK